MSGVKPWKPFLPPMPMLLGGMGVLICRRLDLQDQAVIMYVRLAFSSIMLFLTLTLLFVRMRAQYSGNKTPVRVEEKNKETGEMETKVMTARLYDAQETMNLVVTTLTGFLISGAIHVGFGFVQPIVLQTIVQLYSVLSHPLCKVHLYGVKGIERPFVLENTKKSLHENLNTHTERLSAVYKFWVKGENPYADEDTKPLTNKEKRKAKRGAAKAS